MKTTQNQTLQKETNQKNKNLGSLLCKLFLTLLRMFISGILDFRKIDYKTRKMMTKHKALISRDPHTHILYVKKMRKRANVKSLQEVK